MGLFNGLFEPLLSVKDSGGVPAARPVAREFRIITHDMVQELAHLRHHLAGGVAGWWGVTAQIPGLNAGRGAGDTPDGDCGRTRGDADYRADRQRHEGAP